MSSILSGIGSLVSAAVSWLTTWCQLIVGYTPANEATETAASWNPNFITLFVCLSLVGLGVGLLRRLRNL